MRHVEVHESVQKQLLEELSIQVTIFLLNKEVKEITDSLNKERLGRRKARMHKHAAQGDPTALCCVPHLSVTGAYPFVHVIGEQAKFFQDVGLNVCFG